jgi:hypothetical protein
MEAIRFCETSDFTRSTRLHISENSNLHSHRHESLKSYIISFPITLSVWVSRGYSQCKKWHWGSFISKLTWFCLCLVRLAITLTRQHITKTSVCNTGASSLGQRNVGCSQTKELLCLVSEMELHLWATQCWLLTD